MKGHRVSSTRRRPGRQSASLSHFGTPDGTRLFSPPERRHEAGQDPDPEALPGRGRQPLPPTAGSAPGVERRGRGPGSPARSGWGHPWLLAAGQQVGGGAQLWLWGPCSPGACSPGGGVLLANQRASRRSCTWRGGAAGGCPQPGAPGSGGLTPAAAAFQRAPLAEVHRPRPRSTEARLASGPGSREG